MFASIVKELKRLPGFYMLFPLLMLSGVSFGQQVQHKMRGIKSVMTYNFQNSTDQKHLSSAQYYDREGAVVREDNYYSGSGEKAYLRQAWWQDELGRKISEKYWSKKIKERRTIEYDSAGLAVTVLYTYDDENNIERRILEVSNPQYKEPDFDGANNFIATFNFQPPIIQEPKFIEYKLEEIRNGKLTPISHWYYTFTLEGKKKSFVHYNFEENEGFVLKRRILYWSNDNEHRVFERGINGMVQTRAYSRSGEPIFLINTDWEELHKYKTYFMVHRIGADTNQWGEPTVTRIEKLYCSTSECADTFKLAKEEEYFTYDDRGRVLSFSKKINDEPKQLLRTISYQEDGKERLTTFYIQSSKDSVPLQKSVIEFNKDFHPIYNAKYSIDKGMHFLESEIFRVIEGGSVVDFREVTNKIEPTGDRPKEVDMLLLFSPSFTKKDIEDLEAMGTSTKIGRYYQEFKEMGQASFRRKYYYAPLEKTIVSFYLNGDTSVNYEHRYDGAKWCFVKQSTKLRTKISGGQYDQFLPLSKLEKTSRGFLKEVYNYDQNLYCTEYIKSQGDDSLNLQVVERKTWTIGDQRVLPGYRSYDMGRYKFSLEPPYEADTMDHELNVHISEKRRFPVNERKEYGLIDGKLTLLEHIRRVQDIEKTQWEMMRYDTTEATLKTLFTQQIDSVKTPLNEGESTYTSTITYRYNSLLSGPEKVKMRIIETYSSKNELLNEVTQYYEGDDGITIATESAKEYRYDERGNLIMEKEIDPKGQVSGKNRKYEYY